jgi:hypothetical protein
MHQDADEIEPDDQDHRRDVDAAQIGQPPPDRPE